MSLKHHKVEKSGCGKTVVPVVLQGKLWISKKYTVVHEEKKTAKILSTFICTQCKILMGYYYSVVVIGRCSRAGSNAVAYLIHKGHYFMVSAIKWNS